MLVYCRNQPARFSSSGLGLLEEMPPMVSVRRCSQLRVTNLPRISLHTILPSRLWSSYVSFAICVLLEETLHRVRGVHPSNIITYLNHPKFTFWILVTSCNKVLNSSLFLEPCPPRRPYPLLVFLYGNQNTTNGHSDHQCF